jgi:hypothetical protein
MNGYQNERKAIETYFNAQWAATTPIGFDGQTFTPEADSVQLTIQSGAVLQGSIGRTANRKDHMGNLTVSIYTDGDKGSSAWRGYAETIIGFLMDKTLDDAGAVIATTADAFLRFSPPTQTGIMHPYVSASFKAAPFTQTNIIAPFKRYSFS